MKKPLLKHHKAILAMLILITSYLLFDTPVGEPGQMYAAVIHTEQQSTSGNTTFALQNGVKVTLSSRQYSKGDKVKLWVKQTRFSRKRAFSLTPEFDHYSFAEQQF
ncbi:hypothetical protein [Neptunicella sp. SCSIO 80796]|uniref:hypothetical protein n=1 Tax=Neptunicella plasticusilytica TaxID=3117012 RepID=UPI003A4DB7FD